MKELRTTGVAVAAVALLAACTAGTNAVDPTTSSTSPSSAVTSTSTVNATSTTTSPEDNAAAHAEEVLRAYYRAIPQCLADPKNTPITCFDQVAITTELTNRRNAIASAQAMQTKASGPINLVSVTRTRVDLTNKVTETPPTVPTVEFRVCTDVSGFNIVDKDGKSVVPADRKPHVLVDVAVLNYKYPDPAEWRVGYVVSVKDASC